MGGLVGGRRRFREFGGAPVMGGPGFRSLFGAPEGVRVVQAVSEILCQLAAAGDLLAEADSLLAEDRHGSRVARYQAHLHLELAASALELLCSRAKLGSGAADVRLSPSLPDDAAPSSLQGKVS